MHKKLSKVNDPVLRLSKEQIEPFEDKSSNLAVLIESGYKSYGKYNVLNDLNLNVPTGAM